MKTNVLFATVLVSFMSVAIRSSAAIIVDDFNDGALHSSWQVITQSGGALWNESGGKLNVGGSSGQLGELVIRYDRPIGDVGAIRIDYNWTAYTGHKARVGLGLYDATWDGEGVNQGSISEGVYIKGVRYRTSGLHAVDGGAPNGLYDIAYYVPTTGSLMIERDHDNFRASYLQSGTWHLLYQTQYDFGATVLYPFLFTSNSNTYPAWQVALDNFSFDGAAPHPVPEPSSLVLFGGLAVMSLAVTWRRRWRQQPEVPTRAVNPRGQKGAGIVSVPRGGIRPNKGVHRSRDPVFEKWLASSAWPGEAGGSASY